MHEYFISFTISRNIKSGIRNSDLKVFKKVRKQGMIFRANHRDVSTRSRYLFDHQAVLNLFFAQPPRQTLIISSFLGGGGGRLRGEGQPETH